MGRATTDPRGLDTASPKKPPQNSLHRPIWGLRVLPSHRREGCPSGPHWYREIKYDGFQLRAERSGDRVRLITRGGYDWTRHYPWIVETALKNRQKQFVIDGETVILFRLSRFLRSSTSSRTWTLASSALPSGWAPEAADVIGLPILFWPLFFLPSGQLLVFERPALQFISCRLLLCR
jgi:hypothetical protein